MQHDNNIFEYISQNNPVRHRKGGVVTLEHERMLYLEPAKTTLYEALRRIH